ncbi:hypothetical protein ACFLWT_02090 [Chloroflexota bacterium]
MKKPLYLASLLIILLISSVIFVGQPSEVYAASTAALYPGTAVSTAVGLYVNAPWTSPANVGADDSTTANVGTKNLDNGSYTERLDATNFGFAIPTGSTIDGIVVEYDRFSPDEGAGVTDDLVQLIKGGTPQGTDFGVGAGWATSETIVTFGSSSELWGLTWAAADINASNFGVAVAATSSVNNAQAEIDFLRITVHYTPPPPDISNTPTSYAFGTLATSSTTETGLTHFTVTNNSAFSINITITGTSMAGGTTWTLDDTATPGTDTYGLNAGLEGGSYNIIVKNSAGNALVSGLGASGTQRWGLQLLAPTVFTGGGLNTGTVTLTATQA